MFHACVHKKNKVMHQPIMPEKIEQHKTEVKNNYFILFVILVSVDNCKYLCSNYFLESR